MKMTELFAAQLDREEPRNRRMLERVPEGRNDWKPHTKSMPLGYLSWMVASMPGWIAMAIDRDHLDISGGVGSAADWRTRADLLKVCDDSIAAARRALSKTTDEHLMTTWRLLYAGRVLAEDPRHVVILDGVFGHLAHHRAQLTVYLRLNDVPVPALYGGSADEAR